MPHRIIAIIAEAIIGLGIICAVIGALYLQFRIIHDCGWMAFFHGAAWWWLFGYCH